MPVASTMILNSLIMTGEKSIEVTTFSLLEQNYYLSRLNSMMDSWANERMLIFHIQQTSFAFVVSQAEYTIGPGAAFNMTRPTQVIPPCFVRDSGGYDSPLQIINAEAYGRIVLKSVDGTYPQYLYYDHGFSDTSTATIKFWPEPMSGLTVFLNTLQPFTNFSSFSANVLFPPGYQRAIESNFAVEVAPGFIQLDPNIEKIASKSKAAIKTTNAPDPVLRLDYRLTNEVYTNILTGP